MSGQGERRNSNIHSEHFDIDTPTEAPTNTPHSPVPHFVQAYYDKSQAWDTMQFEGEGEDLRSLGIAARFIRTAVDKLPVKEQRSWHLQLPRPMVLSGIETVTSSLDRIQTANGNDLELALARQSFYLGRLRQQASVHAGIFPEVPAARALEKKLVEYGDKESAYTIQKLIAAYGAALRRLPRSMIIGAYGQMAEDPRGR